MNIVPVSNFFVCFTSSSPVRNDLNLVVTIKDYVNQVYLVFKIIGRERMTVSFPSLLSITTRVEGSTEFFEF